MTVYILSGARTPSGSFMGALSLVPAPRLGAVAITGALKKANVDEQRVEEVLMGNVIQAGEGQAPARQATLFAGLPQSVSAATVNKVCGSGMKTILLGAQAILAHDREVVVAGGMENMSMAPHLIPGSRNGFKFGATEIKDSMQWDGLWDVYSNRPMGNRAEECVKKYEFSRKEQDNFSIESFKRAQKAMADGIFRSEIVPVVIKGKKGDVIVDQDEGPMKADFSKIPMLKPAFANDGTITAANASTINDGAAAVVLAGDSYKNIAKFKLHAYAEYSHDPTFFTTAPIGAMKKCFEKTGLSPADIGVYEINEAFAVVTMAAMKEFHLDHNKVNVYGGAVSLGHPIGCSGTRIVVTLMNAMENKNVKYGMASICIGGGEALSLILEKIR